MSNRRRGLGALVVLLALAAPVPAARYAGDVTDARSGRGSMATITTKPVGDGLRTRIRCKPRRGCPLARRTKVLLSSTGEQYRYTGTFTLKGVPCELDAYVYPQGFQGTYSCAEGAIGSIGGFSEGSRPE
jgi:hypothetical protein